MRRVLPLVVVFSLAGSAAARAAGWQELHRSADDVRIEVAPDGVATITHKLRYRIVAGRFKTFEIAGLDPHALIAHDATVTSDKTGEGISAHVEDSPGKAVVVVEEPKGLSRGIYLVEVHYKLDLVAAKLLARDGAMWKLAWTAPESPEGHDGARVTFDLPPGPTEPRLASSIEAATTLSTLRRTADKDELELVRAHVPRGEAVTWAARVDPKAFPSVASPLLRPPPAPDAPSERPWIPSVIAVCAFATLLGTLLARKRAVVHAACRLRETSPRPMIDVPLGPLAYGVTGAAGLALLLWSSPIFGGVFVVLAAALAAHRAPLPIARPSLPSTWREVADEDAFVVKTPGALVGDVLDAGTRTGRIALAGLVFAIALVTFALRTYVAGVTVALPLACSALLPLFLTGTRAQWPRTPFEIGAVFLRSARDHLARRVDLAHVGVRTTERRSGSRREELRLVCAPLERTPGLHALELALAPSLETAVPEVFVRFEDDSAASARVTSRLGALFGDGARASIGRAPSERVIHLVPAEPTPEGAAKLLAELACALEERRLPPRTTRDGRLRYHGPERRVAPPLAVTTA